MAIPSKQVYTEADYYALPENTRAELIDGQLYYQAVPSRIHQEILSEIHTAINHYTTTKNGSAKVCPAPFAVKLLEGGNTIVEPDISVICDPSKLTDKGCTGAPDWIIEIVSPGNSNHDYVHKLNLYMEAGVLDYWIVDPMKQTVFVYHLEKNKFEVENYTFLDKIKASIYDDLWIDFQEITL